MDVLITGCSTGIGRATALRLAKSGHNVWAGVRSPSSFEDLIKVHQKGLTPILLDVTDDVSIREALSLIRKKGGGLRGLINNAGLAIGGPIEALPLVEWQRQFDVNFFGVVEVTRACLPLLRESKGRVINVSSISGKIASPFIAPYAASKFALEAFSDSLRREVAPFGMHVAVIEPGPVRTPIWKKSLGDAKTSRETFSAEIESLYGEVMTKIFDYMKKYENEGEAAATVATVIEDALTARWPRTRYPVGRGIGLMAGLSGVLPDSWMDRIIKTKVKYKGDIK